MATPEAVEFAALLKDLKDRSGRSYGVLAGKLHVSTSTLHRYCNGDAVPNEYAPIERFARVCGASGDELVEVHRRWIVADAARRRPSTGAASAPAGAVAAVPAAVPDAVPDGVLEAVETVAAGETVEEGGASEPPEVSDAAELSVTSGGGAAPGSRWSRLSRRTRVLIAAAGVAALLVPGTVVAVDLVGSG
ncbi:helix-turn-helix transcriptional regulator, partial [Streptomyces sp. CC216C]